MKAVAIQVPPTPPRGTRVETDQTTSEDVDRSERGAIVGSGGVVGVKHPGGPDTPRIAIFQRPRVPPTRWI